MAYNTKSIITDKDGNPISQYYNPDTDEYEPVEGIGGGNKVIVYNEDGTQNDVSLLSISEKLGQLTGSVIDEETRKGNELIRIDNEDTRINNESNREQVFGNQMDRVGQIEEQVPEQVIIDIGKLPKTVNGISPDESGDIDLGEVVEVVNNLDEEIEGKALDATQGKILKDDLGRHKAENTEQFKSMFINVKYPPSPLVPAIGDGVTDDTDAIQSIIDYSPQGVTVFFPSTYPNSYKITNSIVINKRVRLVGDGKYSTLINAIGFGVRVPIFRIIMTEETRISFMEISNMLLMSDNANANGIYMEFVNQSRFKDLYFYGLNEAIFSRQGWMNHYSDFQTYNITNDCVRLNDNCNNVLFDKCAFMSTNGHGIFSNGSMGGVKFDSCNFENLLNKDKSAIRFEPDTGHSISNISIHDSHFEKIKGYAITFGGTDVRSVSMVSIENNTIFGGYKTYFDSEVGVTQYAIIPTNVYGFRIINNTFSDWGGQAIASHLISENGLVEGNKLIDTPFLTSGGDPFYRNSVEVKNNSMGKKVLYDTSSPQSGDFLKGDIVHNISPSSNSYMGWTCVESGSPGLWKGFGKIGV